MSKLREPKAMREVRTWKAECDAEVAHLDTAAAVRKRLADSAAVAKRLGFRILSPVPRQISVVAEGRVRYDKA